MLGSCLCLKDPHQSWQHIRVKRQKEKVTLAFLLKVLWRPESSRLCSEVSATYILLLEKERACPTPSQAFKTHTVQVHLFSNPFQKGHEKNIRNTSGKRGQAHKPDGMETKSSLKLKHRPLAWLLFVLSSGGNQGATSAIRGPWEVVGQSQTRQCLC